MAGVSANIGQTVTARVSGAAIGATNPVAGVSISHFLQLDAGTGALGKADLLYTSTRTLALSATENLDLTGVLTGPLGASFNAAEVVAIVVEAVATNTNTVNIGGAGTNAFIGPFGTNTDTLKIKPGQSLFLTDTAGWPVTAGTGDLLKVLNGGAGTPVTYTITIIARSVVDA